MATVAGVGLHSGEPARVTFALHDGGVVFRTATGEVLLSEVRVLRTDRGVRVGCAPLGLDVDGVEHCLAALGGLGVYRGVAIAVQGPEIPLADGAALEFARAIASLGPAPEPPALDIVRSGEVVVGESSYRFEPGGSVHLSAEIRFAARHIGVQHATWDGSASAFLRDVAWARTFGFLRDARALAAAGRGLGATPEAVMVLDDEGAVTPPGVPARPAEFARHKLLDLIGDLYLLGGPPRGRLHAVRPGHTATLHALAEACRRGLVVRT